MAQNDNVKEYKVSHCISCPNHKSYKMSKETNWLACTEKQGLKVYDTVEEGVKAYRLVLNYEDENDALKEPIPGWCPYYKDGMAIIK